MTIIIVSYNHFVWITIHNCLTHSIVTGDEYCLSFETSPNYIFKDNATHMSYEPCVFEFWEHSYLMNAGLRVEFSLKFKSNLFWHLLALNVS